MISDIHKEMVSDAARLRKTDSYRNMSEKTKSRRVNQAAALIGSLAGEGEDPLDVFQYLNDISKFFEKQLGTVKEDVMSVIDKECDSSNTLFSNRNGLQHEFELDMAQATGKRIDQVRGRHNYNRGLFLVVFGMSKRSYGNYVKSQGGANEWPYFSDLWKDLELLDVGDINMKVNGVGRRVKVVDSIKRVLDNKITGKLIEEGMMNNTIRITLSGDGANFSEQKGVVTLSISFNAFGSLKHSPSMNIPIAHALCDENGQELRSIFYDVYDELNQLDGEMIQWGEGNSSKIEVYHCNDVKYNVIILGHSPWSCDNGFSVWCECNKCTGDRNDPCILVTDESFKQSLEKARLKLSEFFPIDGTSILNGPELKSKFEKHPRYMEFHKWCEISNHGVTPFGAFPDLINMDRLMIDTLHLKLNVVQAMVRYIVSFSKKHDDARTKKGKKARGHVRVHTEVGMLDGFLNICKSELQVGNSAVRGLKKSKSKHFTGNSCNNFLEAFSPRVTTIIDDTKIKYEQSTFKHSGVLRNYFLGRCGTENTDLNDFFSCCDYFSSLLQEVTSLTVTPGKISILKEGMKAYMDACKRTIYGKKGHKETLYEHTLYYILLRKVENWNLETNQGYGFFSLQGPEHINAVSKYALMRRTNLHFGKRDEYDSFHRILRINRIKLYYFLDLKKTKGYNRDRARKLQLQSM